MAVHKRQKFTDFINEVSIHDAHTIPTPFMKLDNSEDLYRFTERQYSISGENTYYLVVDENGLYNVFCYDVDYDCDGVFHSFSEVNLDDFMEFRMDYKIYETSLSDVIVVIRDIVHHINS